MIENRSVRTNKQQSPVLWLWLVFVTALISRLLLLMLYRPVTYSDTPSYRRLASSVLSLFAKYDGTRTPGYPVFLALAGNDQRVWIAQLLLGFITTLLLFYIGWKLTGRPWFGGLIAMFHTLNLGQLFFESSLLTESLTTFLLVLTMAGALVWMIYPQYRNLWLSFSLGLVSTITLLVRPLFIYLPFFLLIFLVFVIKSKSHSTDLLSDTDSQLEVRPLQRKQIQWRFGIAFILPVMLLLGGWVTFIHARFGDWSLTTMTGFHLIQHTGSFFEYVPDEYASLRDTYIQYRDAHIAEFGTQTNTIWEAIPEMSRASGYNFYDLSKVLARISIQLILKHPWLFMKSAISGWWMFWRTSVYWSPEALRFSWLIGTVDIAIQIQRAILFFINLVFIFSSIYFSLSECHAAIRHTPSRRPMQFINPSQHMYFWFLFGIIWIASILQTLLDHGDNPRFLIPLQSLVVLWVAWFFFQLINNKIELTNSTAQSV
jgi:hypothetical protein